MALLEQAADDAASDGASIIEVMTSGNSEYRSEFKDICMKLPKNLGHVRTDAKEPMETNIQAYVLTVEGVGGARRNAMVQELDRACFTWRFFEGVTTKAPDLRNGYSPVRNLLFNNRNVTDAELACYASHRAIWREIATGHDDAALVFEDDARIIDDKAFYAALADITNNLQQFDLVKFVDHQPKQVALTKQVGSTPFASHKMIATSAACYLVTRKAARKLLDARSHIFRAVDDDWTHPWELGVRIWSVHPNPVATVEDGMSLIEAGRLQSRRERSTLRSLWNIVMTANKQFRMAGYRRKLMRD